MPPSPLRTTVSVLEIVFVGQHELFVCLDFVLTFFFPPLAAKLIGPRMGRQFFKNVDFSITYPLNRNLSKISTWCNLWGMRLNSNKTQSMIVSRSRTVFLPHPDLLVGSTSLNFCDF